MGLPAALLLQLGILAAIGFATMLFEHRRRAAATVPAPATASPLQRLWRGPWPLYAGGLALALLNVVTLALAGHPWTVSFGYTLWAAKLAGGLGLEVADWPFWTWRFPRQALAGSVFANTTSVMNFGLIVGALLAAGLAGRFRPVGRLPWRSVAAAAIGGTLMGYGARLAFGCNVGAYFSGIASGSLHGWLWLLAALLGTYVGVRLRPCFALDRAAS